MAAFTVSGVPGVIAYLRPSHARPDAPLLMVKRPSFPKGLAAVLADPRFRLEPYFGQAREAPRKCKGKKGQGYRECLIKETRGLVKRR